MLKTLRTFGILCWTGCLVTLMYQAATWLLTASWPRLTLLEIIYDLVGWNGATSFRSLPLEYALKALYVLTTTELSLALWWLGVASFVLAMAWRIFQK